MLAPSSTCLRLLRWLAGPETQCPPRQILCQYYSTKAPSRPATATKPPQNPRQSPKDAPPTSDAFGSLEEPDRDVRKAGPSPLDLPLGLSTPPRPGENTGVDTRSLAERRTDFVDHSKHLKRREQLTKELYRPYFKDFTDMQYYKGKLFLAPSSLIKARWARYFPNLRGTTLGTEQRDTTNALWGRVSVVTIASSGWAENQLKTFVDKGVNPGLHHYLDIEAGGGPPGQKAQLVEINYEPNPLKFWLVSTFASKLRAERDKSRWDRYFMVKDGFEQRLRLAIGMPNEKVGQVYLVDRECRIRWAGHAEATPEERASMVSGLFRLLQEGKKS